jgi:hypothetical protein
VDVGRCVHACVNVSLALQVVHADDTWTDVQRVMGSNPGRPVVHMSGTATNPFGPTYVYGYRNAVFEVMRNGNLASVLLFKVTELPICSSARMNQHDTTAQRLFCVLMQVDAACKSV